MSLLTVITQLVMEDYTLYQGQLLPYLEVCCNLLYLLLVTLMIDGSQDALASLGGKQ